MLGRWGAWWAWEASQGVPSALACPGKGGQPSERAALAPAHQPTRPCWLSAGELPASELPGPLAALTALSWLSSRLGDPGCKLLCKAAPALRQLQLGSSAVTDAGLRSLAKLPALASLRLDGCSVTDHGLGALSRLAGLSFLSLDNCWLLSEGGVRALAEGLPHLRSAHLNGADLLPASAAGGPAVPSPGGPQQPGAKAASGRGRGRCRPSPTSVPRASPAAAGSAGRASGGAAARGGRLTADIMEYDERIKWSREELLGLQDAAVVAEQQAALLARLPAGLRRASLG